MIDDLIVLFLDNSPILLSNVSRNGEDLTAFVENGCWDLKIRGNEMLHENEHLNFFTTRKEILVPHSMENNDYNNIISWAKTQLDMEDK